LLSDFFEFSQAGVECDRALSLSPGNATVLYWCSVFDAAIGRFDTAIATALRAVALDPLNPIRHLGLGDALQVARRQSEAIAAYREAIAVAEKPRAAAYARQGVSYYLLGNLQVANELCAKHADDWESVVCLALTLNKLGKRSEAEAHLTKLAALANRYGGGSDSLAYQYGQIQAQWANPHKALDWLQLAVRLRDSGLSGLKTDPLMDPLRKEPRFQAIERALKFPN
jgi:tetratricopeptide (TPR) repeat protein